MSKIRTEPLLKQRLAEQGNVARLSPARRRPQDGDAPGSDSEVGDHEVQFYEDEQFLTDAVAAFLDAGARAGDTLVVIATEVHRESFCRQLESRGVDVPAMLSAGRLTLLDARETLSKFMQKGQPDRTLFEQVIGRLVATLAAALPPGTRLRAYGEMVDLLWRDGRQDAAIHLEELWNDLQRQHSFTLLCAYAMASFYNEPADITRVCGTHSHVSMQSSNDGPPPSGSVSSTHVVDDDRRRLTNEIAHRHEVESALRESVRNLRASEEQLRDFVENATLGLHRVSADGTILWANRAELELLGYSEHEYVGRPISDVHADHDAVCDILARLNRGEELHNYEARLRAKDGSIKHVLISSNVYSRDGKFIHTRCFTRDITERKNLEIARAEAARRAERLLAITAAIADAVSKEQVLEAVVDHVADALGASTAALWLVDEDCRTVRMARARGYHAAAMKQLEAVPFDMTPSFPALDAIRRGEPIWIPTQAALLETYPHLRAVATPGRSYRVACLPLAPHGRVLGCLAITIEEAREASEEEREFLQLTSRYASQAIERLRLLEAERLSRVQADAAANRLGVLSHASRTFADSQLGLPSRLRDVVVELAATMNSCINIALLEPDGLLHLVAVQHPDPEAQELLRTLASSAPVGLGEGVTGAIAATGESLILPSIDPKTIAARAVPTYRAFLERFPAYAVMGAALKVRGRPIGTVTATRIREGESYTTDDLRLLEELAERAAVAIENSRLYEETLGARSRAEQLYRFAQAVVASHRIEEVYEAALASIESALGAKRAAILVSDSDGVMRFKASHGLSDAYRAAVEGHSPWPRNAVAPEPVLVPDVASDAAMASYLPLFARESIAALAFIPLVTEARLLGKFMIYYEEPHPFRPHEIETVAAIANHLASVIARFAAVAKLEDTIRQNELFAGVLAHDLRNPLGAITTAAQVLLRRKEGSGVSVERDQRPLRRIMSSGHRMTTMIDQLLDFTRARSGGGMEVYPHPADLTELLNQAVGELELVHSEWTIARDIRGDHGGTWDSDRLLQVISNLVANAGQHGSRQAPIRVRLDGTNRDRVSIEVHNEGAIPASLLPHLFDPFRSTTHRRDRSSGLGLGLFIVREIVHAHRGTVQVESSEACGTTFRIDLPRHASQRSQKIGEAPPDLLTNSEPAPTTEPEELPRLAFAALRAEKPASALSAAGQDGAPSTAVRSTILIIDDDLDIREALEETLEDYGFAVATAANGVDALRVLGSMSSLPGLILLDLMMPVMDGYGFLDERRKDPALASVPVVVITAGHGFDRNRLGESTPIILKPIKLTQLMNTLRAHNLNETVT
jgi:PAS domain S-box-containing protein